LERQREREPQFAVKRAGLRQRKPELLDFAQHGWKVQRLGELLALQRQFDPDREWSGSGAGASAGVESHRRRALWGAFLRRFGFRDAADYYDTQSAWRFLDAIRVPALLVQAKDDPVIPFAIFERPEVSRNPHIELVAVEHGGHLGFLARRPPRFWAEQVAMDWIRGPAATSAASP